MNVKPEDFQHTKQSILHNKQQFLTHQLSEVSKRIKNTQNQNADIKKMIQLLKSKSNKSLFNQNVQQNLHDWNNSNNKQNESLNGNSQTKQNQKIGPTGIHSILIKNNKKKEKTVQKFVKVPEKVIELEQMFQNQLKQKQKMLQSLQQQISQMKKVWQARQSQLQKKMKVEQQIFTCRQTKTQRTTQLPMQISQTSRMSNNTSFFNNSSSSHNIHSNNNNLNEDHFVEAGTFRNVVPKRKVVSVSLSGQRGYDTGFNFGKKSGYKIKGQNVVGRQSQRRSNCAQNPVSFSQYKIADNHIQRQTKTSSLNTSLTQHNFRPSNSSYLSHSQSNLHLQSKSLRKTNATKSYAKIVTKLTCRGCQNQFRPNQFYMHVTECRQLLKIQLLQEKRQIQEEINQTMNFYQ